MIGLFFEVTPLEGHASSYFELAAVLRPELERSGGVLFIDRYASTDRPEVILSHQWWADEESLIRWRTHTQHRAIQRAGLRARADLEHRLALTGDPRGIYGRFPPAQAGWFADPGHGRQIRYYDGAAWTGHTASR